MDILIALASIAGILGFIYVVFIGQKTWAEWWREKSSSRASAASTTALEGARKPYHNLPQPDYGTFVGREKELAKIRELLSPTSRHFLVTIDGVGGVGKSALALETAHFYLREHRNLPQEERFDAIIWTSAKTTTLTIDGIVTRYQSLRTLDDIYTTIAVALQREDITRARPEKQAEIMRNALTRQRTLLIVDNLETVDDMAVVEFLRELPPPTKAIVTTRHRIDVAYPVRLVGMEWKDAQKLAIQESARKGVTLTNDETRRLYDRTGGTPLAIVWSIAQMSFGYGVEAVLTQLGQPSGHIVRYCFEGAMARIRGKPAHKLLIALSYFASAASREALGDVANLAILDRDEGLVDLEKLSLVNRIDNGKFQMLPLTATLVLGEPDFATDYETKYIDYYRRLANGVTRLEYWGGVKNFANLKAIADEMANLVKAFELCFTKGRWQEAIELCYALVHYCAFTGRLADRISIVEKAIAAAEKQKADDVLAWLSVDALGWVFLVRRDLTTAERHILRGRLAAEQSATIDCIALADGYLARKSMMEGQIDHARALIDKALPTAQSPFILARLHQIAGHISVAQGNLDMAVGHYNAVLEITSDMHDVFETAEALVSLGNTYLKKREFEASKKTFHKGLQLATSEAIIIRTAEAALGLAITYKELGDFASSKRFAREAYPIFEATGLGEEAERATKLI